ncbi:MAG: hypothetical protein ABI624_08560 [Casimicrobiaceae bacterium]
MVKIELRNYDASGEPAPMFATDADIALAAQLRRQLEERYFGASAKPHPLLPQQSGEVH